MGSAEKSASVASWLEQMSATIVHPSPRYLRVLRELLAALARYHGLKWRNPLC
jgi:hypothetical protein